MPDRCPDPLVVHDGTLYTLCSARDSDGGHRTDGRQLDLATGEWTEMGQLPGQIYSGNRPDTVIVDDALYAGFDFNLSGGLAYRYDFTADTWTTLPRIDSTRGRVSVFRPVLLDEHIYVQISRDRDADYLDELWRFATAENEWELVSSGDRTDVYTLTPFVLEGDLYLFGAKSKLLGI